jgi:argininosuccinate synthase
MNVKNLKNKTIALAASGGLDSCCLTKWLSKNSVKVVTFTGDLGQSDEKNLSDVLGRLKACGAKKSYLVEGKKAMAQAGCLAIQAQAQYEGGYWNTTGLGRHVLVSLLLKEMKKRKLNIMAHGATGRGNDQVRFQLAANMLEPQIEVYAPWRDEYFLKKFGGRKEMIEYCLKHKLPIKHSQAKPYSTDANLLGLTHEAGRLESLKTPATEIEPEFGVFSYQCSAEPEIFSVSFSQGFPVKINGRPVNYFQAFALANQIAGGQGIGIGVHVAENRFVGIKSRGVYEMPGITLLGKCYEYLLQLILDRKAKKLFDQLSGFIAEQIYQGYWYDPASAAATKAINVFSALASGTIEVKLAGGQIFFQQAKEVKYNLYSEQAASMEKIGSFNHQDSEGFLRVLGVSAKNLAVKGQISNGLI